MRPAVSTVLAYLRALFPCVLPWRYQVGAQVSWSESFKQAQRWTDGLVSDRTEYLLRRVDAPTTAPQWADEADLEDALEVPHANA